MNTKSLSKRLLRAIKPNVVAIGSVGLNIPVSLLVNSIPPQVNVEVLSLSSGYHRVYFKTQQGAIKFYNSIYGDERSSFQDRNTSHRWNAGTAKGWYPVYACLTLKGKQITWNS